VNEKVSARTLAPVTWCPGCTNFLVLSAIQKFIEQQMQNGKKKEEFGIVSGIGCHAKIFDYLDLPGINTLHGRVVPTCMGLKLAKPELNVLGFSGDGDAYAEGMEHLIHMARYNSDFKYFVHNNQVFALTLGQPTPTTEIGYTDKTNPEGVKLQPFNPIKLLLAAGASFVARVDCDQNQIKEVLEEAIKHRGFAFIEILQPCLIFHNYREYKNRLYDLQKERHDKTNLGLALAKADEFDYDSKTGRIPIGIFYQKERKTFEELKLNK